MNKFTVFIVLGIVKVSCGALPPSVPVCKRSNPNLSQCIASAIETLKPRLVSGDIGGGYSVPKIDPLFVNELKFNENEGIAVRLTGVNMHGISNFKIDKLRANINDLKFDILITVPKLTTTAKYQMAFSFLGNKLNTNGDFFINHENMKILVPIRLRRTAKNGVEVIRVDPIAVQILQFKVTKLNFSNLFGGNKAIEDIIYTLLINNSDFSSSNVRPAFEGNLSRVFTDIANRILENTSFDEMFPV
ncbi:protein takeout-like [Chironomus tepperi]|uniref:protein takeout-like n=1 Tax=Chironomus tepperi TaxID=113505 RepID=UPI00391F6502